MNKVKYKVKNNNNKNIFAFLLDIEQCIQESCLFVGGGQLFHPLSHPSTTFIHFHTRIQFRVQGSSQRTWREPMQTKGEHAERSWPDGGFKPRTILL